MRIDAPAVAPFLRSQTQARLLAELILKPRAKRSITELARISGAAQSVVSVEVDRLVTAGVLIDSKIGRTRLVGANPSYRLFGPLREILAATFGPEPVLSRLLAEIPGIEAAYIHGSWAARYGGKPGREPGDVDVVVIGTPDRAALNDAAGQAEAVLGLPVQITRLRREVWEDENEPFVRTVKQGQMVPLTLESEAG